MEPIKVNSSEIVYHGPTPDIGDLWCRRLEPGVIEQVWALSDSERELVAAGGHVRLVIYSEPIPPVAMSAVANVGPYEDRGVERPFKIEGE